MIMDQTTKLRSLAWLLAAGLACTLSERALAGDHAYATDFNAALKLSGDLHEALSQKFYDQIAAQPVALDQVGSPLIAPVAAASKHQIEISEGFIDFVNRLSHAKAIDKVQKGYFDSYVGSVAQALASNPSASLPPIAEPRFWTDAVLNEQLGYFNQMVGAAMAINMSHFYLGHYNKYADKLTGKATPINTLLTPAEWDVSVQAGTLDALNCGLSTEGLRVMLDALDKMPTRPAWAAYIAPQSADLKLLCQQLTVYEKGFFRGQLKEPVVP
jgi:hypothetical protein